MRSPRGLAIATSVLAALALAGCGDSSEDDTTAEGESSSADAFPLTLKHVYGETVIEEKPERVATVAWSNHEVPLALGVVPVGMSKAAWGDDDGDGVLPWVEEQLEELDAETPVLFDEADGIDFEAVADTQPDVILASYSGLTKEEYETLSKIAPTVAYPDIAWGTSWQDMTRLNSEAIGLKAEGEELVEHLEGYIDAVVEKFPNLQDAGVLVSWIDPADLSQIGFYTTHDTRPGFLHEIGMGVPKVVADASAGTEEFYTTISSEKADQLSDVDVVVTYGDDKALANIQKDPLLNQVAALKNGNVALLADSTPLAASANPSPLSIESTLEEYLNLISSALNTTE